DHLMGAAGMVVAAEREDRDRVAYMIPASILVQSWSEVLAARSIPPCPYRSLGPFSEATAEDFYGRDTEVQTVLDAVEHNAFRHARRSDPGAPGPAASWSAWPKGYHKRVGRCRRRTCGQATGPLSNVWPMRGCCPWTRTKAARHSRNWSTSH